jgi:DNA-directed RNA polymerase specialized sigma subunit
MKLQQKANECGITPSSKEENEKLFRDLIEAGKDGDTEAGIRASQRLVEGNMGYVVAKVDSFLDEHTDFGFLRDDLVSEGFLVLARIAKTVMENGDIDEEEFNPQAMMSVSLRNAFLNMIRLERESPLTDAIEDNCIYDEAKVRDLRLDILACCTNDMERETVRLRCDGLTDDQIANKLGAGRRHICRIREALYERFQETQ